MRSPSSRRQLAVFAALIVSVGVLAAAPASAATTHTALASGVRLTHATFTTAGGRKQSVYWVTVHLSAHTIFCPVADVNGQT